MGSTLYYRQQWVRLADSIYPRHHINIHALRINMYVWKLSLTMVAEQIGVGTMTAIVVEGQAGLTQP